MTDDNEIDADYLDLPDLQVPADMVHELFEPWHELDAAIGMLEIGARTKSGVPEPVTAVIAAREALRLRVYPIMRVFQAAVRERKAAG